MSDILPVSMQDILYRRKSKLRENEISSYDVFVSSDLYRCLLYVTDILSGMD